MVPLVNTKEDAIKAVSYSRYPPHGIRGIGPGRASHYGLRLMSYAQKANDEILVIVQAEHKDAVDHIEEIAGVPGIDMIFVGPFDLASSMGHIGQVDHPEVEAAIEKVLRATIRANRIPGIFCMSADMAIKRAKQGFTFIAVGLDSLYLHSGIAGAMDAVEQAF
jgi:2-keto-3-deoxy-L-rhamnonate aldolase RhmA